jgi:hypothetical protein
MLPAADLDDLEGWRRGRQPAAELEDRRHLGRPAVGVALLGQGVGDRHERNGRADSPQCPGAEPREGHHRLDDWREVRLDEVGEVPPEGVEVRHDRGLGLDRGRVVRQTVKGRRLIGHSHRPVVVAGVEGGRTGPQVGHPSVEREDEGRRPGDVGIPPHHHDPVGSPIDRPEDGHDRPPEPLHLGRVGGQPVAPQPVGGGRADRRAEPRLGRIETGERRRYGRRRRSAHRIRRRTSVMINGIANSDT